MRGRPLKKVEHEKTYECLSCKKIVEQGNYWFPYFICTACYDSPLTLGNMYRDKHLQQTLSTTDHYSQIMRLHYILSAYETKRKHEMINVRVSPHNKEPRMTKLRDKYRLCSSEHCRHAKLTSFCWAHLIYIEQRKIIDIMTLICQKA